MMKRMRLNDNHPLAMKLRKLEDAAAELKLSLQPMRNGGFLVTDTETKQEVVMVDIESDWRYGGIHEFPSGIEYKLVYSKEEVDS